MSSGRDARDATGAGEGAATPATGIGPGVAPLRILVVDDDLAVLKSMRFILELEGYRVTTVSDGRSAIDAFAAARQAATPFGLVITDLSMPHMNGDAVAAAIKQIAPATPVILVTASHERLVKSRGAPPGIDAVLGKPVPDSDLRAAIEACRRVTDR